MSSSKLTHIPMFFVTLGIALAMKYFYSTSSVNDLRWILAPTTWFVELITGRRFTFESQAGYMSSDHTFLIAASCSGVNFLIISFLVLSLGKIRREWPQHIEWRFLPVALIAAYLTTLVANTTRIVIALATPGVETHWLDREELHRVEGIVVYFSFLMILFVAGEKLVMRDGHSQGKAIVPRLKYLLIIYYVVTLGIPLVRGSYNEVEFWQHALFVILVPVILIVTLVVSAKIKDRYVSRKVAPAA